MINDKGKIYYGLGLDNAQLRADAAEARSVIKSIGDTTVSEGNRIDGSMRKIGVAVMGAFSVQQAAQFAKTVVDVRGEIEALEKSFVVLAGHKGIPLFNEIRAFATDTTFQLGDLAKGAQTLMAFNIEADRVMPILRQIGDISMGNVDKFNSLILAFAQMSSTGKLMGQDLLQMINAGFNPLTVISDKTGKSIAQLKKEMEQGGITSDMVADAFESATAAGGKFNGMLEDQSKGIKGLKSNLEGAWEEALNSIGEKNEEVIKGSIQGVTLLVQNYEKVGRVIAELIGVYGVYKAALITLNAVEAVQIQLTSGWTLAELAHYKALVLVEKAQKLLNATILKNPYVAAAAAVAALAYGLYKYFEVENQAKKAAEDHKTAIDTLNQKYGEEQNRIDSLINTIRDETTARVDRIVAMNELKGLYPNIFDKYIDEKGHIRDLIGLQRELNEAQANRRMAEEGDILTDYERKLRDYKQLQKATANGWSWASAGTYNNVNDLTEDWSFWQSKDSFLEEKVAYWEQMVAKQRKVVDENNYTRFVSSLADKTDEELERLRLLYDKTGELTATETRRLEAINSEISSRKPAAVVENKAYWEDYVKQQQKMLDNMTEAQLKTEEAARIRANITKGQKKIDAYKVNGNKEETEAQRIQRETAERNEQIQQYGEAVSREVRQAELDIAQSKIDAMEEGFAKQQAQIKLTYDRMIFENQQREQEWVEALRDSKELEWQNANPNYKKEGKTFDRSTVTTADLTPEQKARLQAYTDFAAAYQRDSNQKLLEDTLGEFLTYEQKKHKIVEEYANKREELYQHNEDGTRKKDAQGNDLLIDGATQGNIDLINQAETEDLYQLEVDAKKVSSAITALFQDMSRKTTADIKSIAEKGREALDFLTADTYDAELGLKLGISEEQYNYLKNTPTELEKIRKGIEDCDEAATKSENAFEKMASGIKKIVNAGDSLSELDKGIGMLQEGVNEVIGVLNFLEDAFSGLGDAFGSDVLSGIGEGVGVVTDALSSTMSGVQAGAMFGPWGAAIGGAIGLATSLAKSIAKIHDKKHEKEIARLGEQINTLQKSYETLGEQIENAYSKDASNLIEQQNEMLKQQQLLIKQQIAEEEAKKNTDQERINEWKQQIEDIDKQIADNKEAAVDAVFGSDLQNAIENFASAYADAWANGTKSSQTAKDYVRNMMRDMVTESIKAAIQSSKAIEEIRAKLLEFYADGVFDAAEQEWAYKKAEELQNDLDAQFGWADGLFTDEATREGAKSGIATASQESVDELNGRATAIQSHTYTIAECQKLLVETTMQLLEAVWGIQRNTDRLETIENDMRSVKNTVNDIALKGIKLK